LLSFYAMISGSGGPKKVPDPDSGSKFRNTEYKYSSYYANIIKVLLSGIRYRYVFELDQIWENNVKGSLLCLTAGALKLETKNLVWILEHTGTELIVCIGTGNTGRNNCSCPQLC
jgi:hypothetical protein